MLLLVDSDTLTLPVNSSENTNYLADHHGALAVRLEADETVSDVAPGVLKLLRKAHVAGLVEARLKLHQHCDLRGESGSQQNGASTAKEIKGLL